MLSPSTTTTPNTTTTANKASNKQLCAPNLYHYKEMRKKNKNKLVYILSLSSFRNKNE